MNFVADNTFLMAAGFGALIETAVLYTWWMRTDSNNPDESVFPPAASSGVVTKLAAHGD